MSRWSLAKSWLGERQDSLTVGALAVMLVFAAYYLRGWEQSILVDRSFYLYAAQQIAIGRIPYVDFFNPHPPLAKMLVALPMWLFPRLLSGTGPAYVHVGWSVLWTWGAATGLYYLGKRVTGQWMTGALASFILVGLTPLAFAAAVLGHNRLFAMMVVVVAVAFMAHERWWWAGVVTGAGLMAYYPTALALGGTWVLITGKRGQERWRALGRLGMGLTVSIGLVLGWLAARGGLGGLYRMSVEWLFAFGLEVFQSKFGATAVDTGWPFARSLKMYSRAYRFVGDWLPLLAVLSYLAFILRGLLKTEHRRELWKDSRTVPLLVTSVLTTGYVLVETGDYDRMLSYPYIALWAGWGLGTFIQALRGVNARLAQGVAVAIVLSLVVASGHMIDLVHQRYEVGMIRQIHRWKIRPEPQLDEQIKAAETLWEYLPADHRLLVMGELWPLVVSGEENASPFYHAGPKNRLVAERAGLVEESIFKTALQADPELVLFSVGRANADYEELAALAVEEGYVCVGIANRLIIYVRPDDAAALAGTLAMQQVFESGKNQLSPPFEVISPAQLSGLTRVEGQEVAPGMILLGHELVPDDGTGHLTLYWWTWMPKKEQASLRVEAVNGEEPLATWPVAQPPLPPNTIVRETLTLDASTPLPDDLVLRLAVAPKRPLPQNHPCQEPMTIEPVILRSETGT